MTSQIQDCLLGKSRFFMKFFLQKNDSVSSQDKVKCFSVTPGVVSDPNRSQKQVMGAISAFFTARMCFKNEFSTLKNFENRNFDFPCKYSLGFKLPSKSFQDTPKGPKARVRELRHYFRSPNYFTSKGGRSGPIQVVRMDIVPK